MVRPLLLLVAALVAGCTAPAYTCGHPVPCARGSVQSCTSRDGARCRYLLSDGTAVECAACDDCFAAEREIASWCAVGSSGGDGAGGGGADLAVPPTSDGDLGVAHEPPHDLSTHARDLATAPPDDLSSGTIDTDLGCYGFNYACNSDPTCCSRCCAGGCTVFGYCALQ